jgi:surface protein
MFRYCSSLSNLNLDNWKLSSLTDASQMFRDTDSLTSLDLSSWDTSGVGDSAFQKMFYECTSLISVDLSGWDVTSVTTLYWMFYECTSLTSVNLSGWDTSNVTDFRNMLYDCSSMQSLNLGNLFVINSTKKSGIMSNLASNSDSCIIYCTEETESILKQATAGLDKTLISSGVITFARPTSASKAAKRITLDLNNETDESDSTSETVELEEKTE